MSPFWRFGSMEAIYYTTEYTSILMMISLFNLMILPF